MRAIRNPTRTGRTLVDVSIFTPAEAEAYLADGSRLGLSWAPGRTGQNWGAPAPFVASGGASW